MDDPYKVLGVSPDASDQEIKQAYRKLVKQYHPDRNPGDPVAAKKMQEINAAYEQIKNPEKAGPSGGGGSGSYRGYGGYDPFGGYGPFGGYQQTYRQEEQGDPYLRSAYQYIVYGRYQEALNVLSSIQDRSARWYYLSALANDGLGNQITAMEHIRRAVSMEPDNVEYLQALRQMENGEAAYRRQAGSYRGFSNGSSICPSLCMCYLAQMFCCRGYYCC